MTRCFLFSPCELNSPSEGDAVAVSRGNRARQHLHTSRISCFRYPKLTVFKDFGTTVPAPIRPVG